MNPTYISSNYDMAFNIGWAENIRAVSYDEASMSQYGKKVGKPYRNTKIRDYDIASNIADKIVSAYSSPINKGSIVVDIEPTIKLGDVVTVDIPEIDVDSEDFEVVAYKHTIGRKGNMTEIQLGKENFDVASYVARIGMGYNRARSG